VCGAPETPPPYLISRTPATTPPAAQHAVRQARHLGDNLVAVLRGEPARLYAHRYIGSVASLGLYKGVAELYGVQLRGAPAWFLHRTYHLAQMPTLNRKVRIGLTWAPASPFRRDPVSFGAVPEMTQSREEPEEGARDHATAVAR
jgi:NADH dehydrogenase